MEPQEIPTFDPDQVLDNADTWWRDCAERALLWWARSGAEFEAYDLVGIGVPEPDKPHRWGPLFLNASARGLIEPVRYQPSARPTRHGGVCRIWRGTQAVREAA
ncbi:hypothetical protein [Ornithinimicrobium sp. W1665]|uniref:hypothetical protein n=1 Tax=Ornithinimicrobium sp. W1665 TaxID=3416666 RepID=UPI003CF11570